MVTYKESGVNIAAGDELVERLRKICPEIGGFSGLYPLGDNYLVAGTDGVGTKLKLAFEMDCHDTVGIDLVAMSVNDILTVGAKPLFFLDYFATSKLNVEKAEKVLKGIVAGCKESSCILLGGETAEMPGFYKDEEYDLAGFAVGIVSKKELIDGKTIQVGDLLIGIPSNGLHSNGFSLVREILNRNEISLESPFDHSERSIGEILLAPTCIYASQIFKIYEHWKIKGMAHITGGGIIDNVPRMFSPGLGALIDKKRWKVPSIFRWLQARGDVSEEEMYRTFNMGLGMIICLSPRDALALCEVNNDYRIIGEVISEEGVAWA